MEDNQATITIRTNGSPTQMRHADRTQRVSFGWLKQQFESEQFVLTNVNTNSQAADILTKPFTSPAKWDNAIHLLGMRYVKQKPSMVASRGDGDYDRLLVEFCCSDESKPIRESGTCRSNRGLHVGNILNGYFSCTIIIIIIIIIIILLLIIIIFLLLFQNCV